MNIIIFDPTKGIIVNGPVEADSPSQAQASYAKVGEYAGRVLCRASGSFDIATKAGRIAGISYKYCLAIHKKDGYSYAF